MSLFNFLPQTLTSQAAAGAGGFDVMSLVTMGGMIVVLGLVFYFFLYRSATSFRPSAASSASLSASRATCF